MDRGRGRHVAVRAVRGAIQLEETSAEAVQEGAMRLVQEVLGRNELSQDDLISVLFTNTPDLIGDFPAVGARMAGLTEVPLMCAVEIAVPGALPRVVRLMAHVLQTGTSAPVAQGRPPGRGKLAPVMGFLIARIEAYIAGQEQSE